MFSHSRGQPAKKSSSIRPGWSVAKGYPAALRHPQHPGCRELPLGTAFLSVFSSGPWTLL